MRPSIVPKLLRAVVAVLALAATAHADAGLFRSYLSLAGNDANPCTLQQPCRLLPAALAAVNAGGEIWMLDSANFNTSPVSITKSVTILAVPGALGSIVASGGDALVINAAGIKVALRNLVLLEFSAGANGIHFVQGAEVTVEECEIYGMPANGVLAQAPGGKLSMKNTVVRDNAQMGVQIAGNVTATLARVHVLGNGTAGIGVSSGPKVTISDSVIANHSASGASTGVTVASAGGTQTQVVVERSVLSGNTFGAFAQTNNAGDNVQLAFSHDAITQNGTGYSAGGVASSVVNAVLDDDTITHNTTGVNVGFGVVTTRANNTFLFNASDVTGGALTTLTAQ
jgi:hypothetical protein